MGVRVPVDDGSGEPSDEKRDLDEWKEQTKAVERVIAIALTLDKPRPVKWIADESCVAEQTARDHLKMLGELGIVASTMAHGVTKYRADEAYLRFREVAEIVERYDREEILESKQTLVERQEVAREDLDASSPGDLRSQAAEAGSTEEIRELRQAASEWESLEHRIALLERAYSEYEMHGSSIEMAEA